MDRLSATTYNNLPAWSAEDTAEAIKLYNEGWSMGDIGIRFHKTRNAVAGLLHRERKKAGNIVAAYRGHVNHSKKPHRDDGLTQVELLCESLKLPPDVLVTIKRKKRVRLKLIEDVQRVTMLQLKPHHCRFPFGDPRNSDFRFCGRPRAGRGPYCEMHTKLAGRMYEKANQEVMTSAPA